MQKRNREKKSLSSKLKRKDDFIRTHSSFARTRTRIQEQILANKDNIKTEAIGHKREQKVFCALDALKKEGVIVGYLPSGKLSEADLSGIDVFVIVCDAQGRRNVKKIGIGSATFVFEQKIKYPDVIHIPMSSSTTEEDIKEFIKRELQ